MKCSLLVALLFKAINYAFSEVTAGVKGISTGTIQHAWALSYFDTVYFRFSETENTWIEEKGFKDDRTFNWRR